MKKIYIAGSLFTEAEQSQRMKEERYLKDQLDDAGIIAEVFNPINNPFNDKTKKPTALSIFKGDTEQIREATHLLVNLDNPLDAGVFAELGQAYEMGDIEVFAVLSDMRMPTAGDYEEEEVPYGYNQYIIGLLQDMSAPIYRNYKEAIEGLVEWVS